MLEYFGLELFATKGIEYIVVIGYLLVLVPFGFVLSRAKVGSAVAGAVSRVGRAMRSWFQMPEGYHFHPGHSWAAPDGEDEAHTAQDDGRSHGFGSLNGMAASTSPAITTSSVPSSRSFIRAAMSVLAMASFA